MRTTPSGPSPLWTLPLPAGFSSPAIQAGPAPVFLVRAKCGTGQTLGVDVRGRILWRHGALAILGPRRDGRWDVLIPDGTGDPDRKRPAVIDPASGRLDEGGPEGPRYIPGFDEEGYSRLTWPEDGVAEDLGPRTPLVWAGGRAYQLVGRDALCIRDGSLSVCSTAPIPWEELPARWLASLPGGCVPGNVPVRTRDFDTDWIPGHCQLAADPWNSDLLLTSERPSWTVAFDREGRIRWSCLAGFECCSLPARVIPGRRTIHASSCGRALVFIDGDGRITGCFETTRAFGDRQVFVDGDGVLFAEGDRILALDDDGQVSGSVAIAGGGCAEAVVRRDHGIVAAVRDGSSGGSTLMAFDACAVSRS
jgi:hypothetical protein